MAYARKVRRGQGGDKRLAIKWHTDYRVQKELYKDKYADALYIRGERAATFDGYETDAAQESYLYSISGLTRDGVIRVQGQTVSYHIQAARLRHCPCSRR